MMQKSTRHLNYVSSYTFKVSEGVHNSENALENRCWYSDAGKPVILGGRGTSVKTNHIHRAELKPWQQILVLCCYTLTYRLQDSGIKPTTFTL